MSFADRGKKSEKKVQEFLEIWQAAEPHREYSRLVDTKAAGRIIKAADADFQYFADTLDCIDNVRHGLIEVKETEHEYRLARAKVPQLPRLRKREKCGGRSAVLVFHSTLKKWRLVWVLHLANEGDKGSWNLSTFETYDTPGQALAAWQPEVFG